MIKKISFKLFISILFLCLFVYMLPIIVGLSPYSFIEIICYFTGDHSSMLYLLVVLIFLSLIYNFTNPQNISNTN